MATSTWKARAMISSTDISPPYDPPPRPVLRSRRASAPRARPDVRRAATPPPRPATAALARGPRSADLALARRRRARPRARRGGRRHEPLVAHHRHHEDGRAGDLHLYRA